MRIYENLKNTIWIITVVHPQRVYSRERICSHFRHFLSWHPRHLLPVPPALSRSKLAEERRLPRLELCRYCLLSVGTIDIVGYCSENKTLRYFVSDQVRVRCRKIVPHWWGLYVVDSLAKAEPRVKLEPYIW